MEGGAIIFNRLRYCAITIPVTNIQRFGSPWNIFLLIYFVPFIQGKHESRINDWERKNMKHKVCSCHYGPLFIFLCIDLLGLKKCICVARWYFVIKQRSEWVSEWVSVHCNKNQFWKYHLPHSWSADTNHHTKKIMWMRSRFYSWQQWIVIIITS